MNSAFCKNDRLEAANKVLSLFASDTTLRIDATGYVVVEWTTHGGQKIARRWMTRGQDFYPVWNRQWCHGGTASTALSQLVRWIQGRPVLGISSWLYWGSEKVNLFGSSARASRAIQLLHAVGYPDRVPCVLCGDTEHIGDWWSLHGVSGPCCSMRAGCRQQAKGGA